MSDIDKEETSIPMKEPWIVRVDARDVIGAAGAVLMVSGAALVHPGLAVALAGVALFGAAWKLSR